MVSQQAEALNKASDFTRTYRAFKLGPNTHVDKQWGKGETHAWSLLRTTLGRSLLHRNGWNSLVIRPVYAGAHWSGHAVALVCSSDGEWNLHDPLESEPRVAREGFAGIVAIRGAYAFLVNDKSDRGPYAVQCGKRKREGKRLVLPASPSMEECGLYVVKFTVGRAFARLKELNAYPNPVMFGHSERDAWQTLPGAATSPLDIWHALAKRDQFAASSIDYFTVQVMVHLSHLHLCSTYLTVHPCCVDVRSLHCHDLAAVPSLLFARAAQ